VLGRHILQQETAGTGAQRVVDILIQVERGEDDDARAAGSAGQLPRGLNPVRAGSVLYLALVGLLSLGIATIVRDSAAATGAVLGILYVTPIIALFLGSEPTWQRRFERYAPMNAGLAIEDTTGLRHLPIGPWAGLGVLAGWTAAALLISGLLLRLRDA
jgi:hypothetical protein